MVKYPIETQIMLFIQIQAVLIGESFIIIMIDFVDICLYLMNVVGIFLVNSLLYNKTPRMLIPLFTMHEMSVRLCACINIKPYNS